MVDLVIRGGNVLLPSCGFVKASVAVDDGKIVCVGSESSLPSADRVVDATGRHVVPGLIDPHIHLGIYSPLERDCRETMSAVAGGVTTVGCFVRREGSYLHSLPEVIRTLNSSSFADVIVHTTVETEEHLSEMGRVQEEFGVTAFKFYMYGVPGLIPSKDDAFILRGFQQTSRLEQPAIACVHAENASIVEYATANIRSKKPDANLVDWALTHPNIAELEAVQRAVVFSLEARSRLYIVHVTTKESIEFLSKHKGAVVEVVTPYLVLSRDDNLGPLGKKQPPLRERDSVNALWQAVSDGVVDVIGTDSVPANVKVKQPEKGLWECRGGFSMLGVHLPLLLDEGFHRRGVSLERIVELTSTNPSKVFGLYPRKGAILPGSDADLTVIDLLRERKVSVDETHSVQDFSPVEGRTLKGWPVVTVKGGGVVVEENQFQDSKNTGRYISRLLP